MSETKWTPGPYTCDPMPGPHQPRIEGNGKLIAVVGNAENWVEAKAEWEANAQLFTAAPDMYDALESLCAALVHEHNRDLPYWRAATAALASARGETNE